MTSEQPDRPTAGASSVPPTSPASQSLTPPRQPSRSRSALIALAIVAACLGALALCIAVFWALILFLAEPIDDGPDEGEVTYGLEWTDSAPLLTGDVRKP